MTIHMAKGLEFNTVHIAGCDEEIFPLVRGSMTMSSHEMNEQMEEERRLFYVGCTRAEKKLYLYHAERRFFQGNIRPFAPSRFLKELDPSVVDFVPCTDSGFGGFGGGFDDFNQDRGGYSRPSRPNLPPAFARRPSSSGYSSSGYSSGGSSYGNRSYSYGRPAAVPNSIRKNDKHIVYRNPIKVAAPTPAAPSGPRVVYDEYSENPYRPGVKVRHIKYGVGTITGCSGSGENARVDVRFGDGTTRTIVLKYAALQILG